MRCGDFFSCPQMMVVRGAYHCDVKALTYQPLDDTVELGNERTDQIVQKIDAARSEALLILVGQSMESKNETIPLIQACDIVSHGYAVETGEARKQFRIAAFDSAQRVEFHFR